METINTVALELQCWYQWHSICWYLARQTRQCLAATTLQCWKWHIWLSRWFAQQAEQHQRCLRLCSLCHGASAYTVSVWGNCRPSPTPTNKTSHPKLLCHLFGDRGLPLPRRRQARQNNNCSGQRHWPRAPDSGGGLLCMPLCFWATQTAVAASGLFCWGREVKPYTLPPFPLCCITCPTGLQVLRLLDLTTQQSHHCYAICSRFLPHTAQLSPFQLWCQIGVQTVHPLDKKGVRSELYLQLIRLLSPEMQQHAH